MVNAAIREGGKEDCGYTHECKTRRLLTTWLVEVKSDEQLNFWPPNPPSWEALENWAPPLQVPPVINLWNLNIHVEDNWSGNGSSN